MSIPVQFQVPAGLGAGDLMRVSAPNGQQVDIPLPAGIEPGQTLQVDLRPYMVQQAEANPTQTMNYSMTTHPSVMSIKIPKGVTTGQTIAVDTVHKTRVNIKLTGPIQSDITLLIDGYTGEILFNPLAPYSGASGATEVAAVEENGGKGGDIQVAAVHTIAQASTYPSWLTFPGSAHQALPWGLWNSDTTMAKPMPSGNKKALIIGINYHGTAAPLNGSINDVFAMKKFLLSKGFEDTPETMLCLFDSCPIDTFKATKNNILRGIQWLVAGAGPGDTLFFHFSGHGSQEPDSTGKEMDGLVETLIPQDFNLQGVGTIQSSLIWELLVAKIPNGCRLYGVTDVCHCGDNLMDLSYKWLNDKWALEGNPSHADGDIIVFTSTDATWNTRAAYTKFAQAPGGILTQAFISCANRLPDSSLGQFALALSSDMAARGHPRIPQMNSSQPWSPFDRKLDFHDGIFPNKNTQHGKMVTQRYNAATPNYGDSPLGQMLTSARLNFSAQPQGQQARRGITGSSNNDALLAAGALGLGAGLLFGGGLGGRRRRYRRF